MDALHGVLCELCVCVRGPLLRLWSAKSAVLLQWIKPMIHGLQPQSPLPAFIHSQTDKETRTHVCVSVGVCRNAYGPAPVCTPICVCPFLGICLGMHLCSYVYLWVLGCGIECTTHTSLDSSVYYYLRDSQADRQRERHLEQAFTAIIKQNPV